MSYYILSLDIEDEEEDAFLMGSSSYIDRIDTSFDDGEEFDEADLLLPFEIEVMLASTRGRMTDNLFIDELDCNLFSGKAKALIDKKELKGIQFFPLKLNDPYTNADEVEMAKLKDEEIAYEAKLYENYFIFNATALVDCVDHQKSEIEYFSPRPEIPEDLPEEMKAVIDEEGTDNDIDFIHRLVLDKAMIPADTGIFRLRDCPRILVFKEAIVKVIREAQLSGFVFIPLEQYTDAIEDEEEDANQEASESEQNKPASPTDQTTTDAKLEKVDSKPSERKKIIIKRR